MKIPTWALVALTALAVVAIAVLTALHDPVPAVLQGIAVATVSGHLALAGPVVAQSSPPASSGLSSTSPAPPAAAVPSSQLGNAGWGLSTVPPNTSPPGA